MVIVRNAICGNQSKLTAESKHEIVVWAAGNGLLDEEVLCPATTTGSAEPANSATGRLLSPNSTNWASGTH